ncbi:glycosyltransferase [Candidatus Albibeggiatoa sp. nov. NOAA]|uniref:glycosyltransferase n=1 Tax=Candidatus Albibeggiatoa sp. nov. NOAA TaxID=3162724 RepID=UPI0032F273DD|nr:glycosyltransferase [Thiotrichaceae bacterium]
MKNILWVTTSQIANQGGVLTSAWASTRYRVIMPAYFLAARNHNNSFLFAKEHFYSDELASWHTQDVVIFSKSNHISNEQRAIVAKQRGIKVVFDLCDNYFDSKEQQDYAQHCQSMIALADTVTVNTPELASVIEKYTGKKTIVIPDPYEYPQQPAYFQSAAKRLNLLWFGNYKNIDTLQSFIPKLTPLSAEIPITLHIVTKPNRGIEGACERFNTQSDNYQLTFSPWSLEATQQAMQQADIVIIPSLNSDVKTVKSPNRLIESVRSGRFVVAHPLPAYQEFAKWVWVQSDLVDGIRWALQNPQQVVQNIQTAQQYVSHQYSPERAGLLWEQVVNSEL